MKAVQVAAGLDEPGAGPSYSVRRLSGALEALEVQAPMHCVENWRGPPDDTHSPVPIRHRQDGARVPGMKNLCLSKALHAALRREAGSAQVIHAHGLWLMPDVYPAWVCREARVPFVLSPRGMLGEAALGFSKWKKQAFWNVLQGPATHSARCLHATGHAEYEEIRAFGLANPVAVIPNGVEIPATAPLRRRAAERTLLTLGRLHPKKGLPNLLRAWAKVEPQFHDWRLRIVGPDEGGHAAELTAMARDLGLKRVGIEGPLYAGAKTEAYQTADLFVLPTLNENFALTVAEALAAGTPVIASKGAPWAQLDARGCGWWVDADPDPLAQALSRAMASPAQVLAAMGDAGRRWMQEAFSWEKVALDMLAVYRWLAGEAPAPGHIRLQ